MTTLFGKLQEHEMELKRLDDDVEEDKKKKILDLQVKKEKVFDFSEEMSLILKNFKRFMKHVLT